MFNFDVSTMNRGWRLRHRHGDEWMEMSPAEEHTPDSRDPERRMLRGEQVYRCQGCDDEVQFAPPDSGEAS